MKRIVMGWDAGEPIVLVNDTPPMLVDDEQNKAWEVWIADDTPPDLLSTEDTAQRPWSLEPPKPRGSIFRVIEFHAGSSSGMHSTETLDYIVILSGEITLRSPVSEVVLQAGDTVVQRGVPHDWINHTDESCFAAAVLISAAGSLGEIPVIPYVTPGPARG